MREVVATVHLVCGPVGAGKTTYSRKLAQELRAARFSLDDWVVGLFGRTMPDPLSLDWWIEHCDLCSARLWLSCRDLLAVEIDVILDFGFCFRAHRDRYRALAAAAGAQISLHVLDVDPALRRQRVQARNRDKAETYALTVTDEMFDTSETWWEPPTADELGG
jgi:predicted kinase